jgi:LPXTG-motif cell wall-anchored protein
MYGIDPITISAIVAGVSSLATAGVNAAGAGAQRKAQEDQLKYEIAMQNRAQQSALQAATLQSQALAAQIAADKSTLIEKNKQKQFYAVIGIAGVGLIAGLATLYFLRKRRS